MNTCRIEELSHTAEIGLRVQADTVAKLFRCVALGMAALTGPAPTEGATCAYSVALAASDLETLLVDWLNELVYLGEVHTFHIEQVRVERLDIAETGSAMLTAMVAGRPVAEPPTVHIKAATYHQLSIHRLEKGWQAEVYFDV